MARNDRVRNDENAVAAQDAEIFTYIGVGDEPPRKINFMGMQEFVRGKATEVTDQRILAKIRTNASFIEGEVEMELLHERDEKATKKAEEQRGIDKRINALFHKKHKTE